jgi:magnesium-transporting ATPase (P-type)
MSKQNEIKSVDEKLTKKLQGLTDAQVLESREKHGKNEIEEAPPETFLHAFIESFKDPIIMLLMCIAGLYLVLAFFKLSEFYEPIGIFLTMCLVAFVNAKTSTSADKKFRALKDSTKKENIKVYRNGVLTVIDVSEIVVGDIVVLQSGDKVPADGTLVSGKLSINNASLNGETEEAKKIAADEDWSFPEEIVGDTLVDKHSLFKGTTVYDGEGYMEVAKVGMKTMMGEMAADMTDEDVESPLQLKLKVLAGQISKFGYIGAITIAIVYMIHYVLVAGGIGTYLDFGAFHIFKDVMSAIVIAMLIVVCAVPEGLPLMIAIVLQQNTGKMLDLNVLVRKAIGIETAGSLNVLFSDKTGTITKGMLEVVRFFTADGNYIELDELSTKAGKVKGLLDLSIGKNTNSMFDNQHRVVGGNATDQALVKFLGEDRYNVLSNDSTIKVDAHQGFNSSNKFSQAYIGSLEKTFYKGAPERLLAKATKYLAADGTVKDIDKEIVNKTIDNLAEKAMRVLAFGYSDKELTENSINDDVVIIGFVAIRDDVRPEAKDAIAEVKEAGIQVVMITGDRLETAVAIGKDSGLLTGNIDVLSVEKFTTEDAMLKDAVSMDTIALSSDVLQKLSDDAIKQILPKIRVIARALPKDKSRMVKLTQELGLVCGMTGDGTNDAPALKRADVGFAMGSGTEAAKEAAEIVILDDNFQSIRHAILYGRTIYHNILKFCKFQLSINVGAVLISALLPFIGIEAPLTVTHLLFVNLVMDTMGALLLGQEPAIKEYLKEAPRKRDDKIVNAKMFTQFVITGVYMLLMSILWFKLPFMNNLFTSNETLKTGFFAAFMFSAIFNGFNVRTDGLNIFYRIKENGNFFKVMLAMLAVTILLCVIGGPVGEIFNCSRLALKEWPVVLAASIFIIPFDMLRKAITKMFKK